MREKRGNNRLEDSYRPLFSSAKFTSFVEQNSVYRNWKRRTFYSFYYCTRLRLMEAREKIHHLFFRQVKTHSWTKQVIMQAPQRNWTINLSSIKQKLSTSTNLVLTAPTSTLSIKSISPTKRQGKINRSTSKFANLIHRKTFSVYADHLLIQNSHFQWS